ncbi:MAG: SPFH domain-containing protein [Bacteroidaceae bacterium]|nr:SPFH domain-containing protein [Bacteroidaceae bacterium]
MGLFGRGKSGGMMNVIRCDEEEYMVWKWRPEGQDVNTTSRENSIRYGSSLRVKDGEVAVFVYKQANGTMQDFIEGPYDDTIKTANFPILSSIVGMAYGGESPFQAEIYFINLQGNNQLRFVVPYFDVFDPRLPDHAIPIAVRGSITFSITDYRGFVKLNRLVNFDHDRFMKQIKDALVENVKGVVVNVPKEMGIPVVQMEGQVINVSTKVKEHLRPYLEETFGVNLRGLFFSALEIDKDSPGYEEVYKNTAGHLEETLNAQKDVNIQNLIDTQRINAENMEESLRIQREEAQRAQRLQTEQAFIGAHALNKQTEVLRTAAGNLSQMGNVNLGGQVGSGGLNPAGMMTGMMMGGAMGQQMAGMMQNLGQQMQGVMNTPPPIPNIQYHVVVNGAQAGPFTLPELQQMAQKGQFTKQSYVWKPGMANWDLVGNVPELSILFIPVPESVPPPLPPDSI